MKSLLLLTTLLILSATPLHASGKSSSGGPYLALEPAIVVNLRNADGQPVRIRFMQVKAQVMSESRSALKALEEHAGPVRHSLISLLSGQTADMMYDPQIREEVRQQALESLREVLESHAGIQGDALQALYFTDLVIQ